MKACHETPVELIVLTLEPKADNEWTAKAIHLHVGELRARCPREVQHQLAFYELIEWMECVVAVYGPNRLGLGVQSELPFL